MSVDANAGTGANELDAQQAHELIFQHVTAPVFFNKLAASGIVPVDENQGLQLLRIGQQLLALEEIEHVKQAQAQSNDLSQLISELDTYLGWNANTAEPNVKAAADYFASDPKLLAAARTLAASI